MPPSIARGTAPWQSRGIRANPARRKPLYAVMTVSRAAFCHRLMAVLRLVAKQGYIRNDARTRGLLGYDLGIKGSKHLSNRLCGYATDGILCRSAASGGTRLYRMTNRGRLALETNAQHAQRNTLSARIGRWLAANPQEELSNADVCTKFGASVAQVRRAIDYLAAVGIAERVRVVRLARPARGEERRAA